MCIYTVNKVDNSDTKYNYILIYAVVPLFFWIEEESPERDSAASMKVNQNLSKLKLILRPRQE